MINITKNYHETELTKDYRIAQSPWISAFLLTNIQLANRFAEALSRKAIEKLQTKDLQQPILKREAGTRVAEEAEQ